MIALSDLEAVVKASQSDFDWAAEFAPRADLPIPTTTLVVRTGATGRRMLQPELYLLGSQQGVADLVSRDRARPIAEWLLATRPGRNDLFVSAISLGQVAHMIEAMPTSERQPWRRLLAAARRSWTSQGSIVDIDMSIIDIWARELRGTRPCGRKSRKSGDRFQLGEDDRLVIASAIARGYSLVTQRTELLEKVAQTTTLTIVEP